MTFTLPSAFDGVISTPLQSIEDEITKAAGVKLLLKREDIIHPQISGNKWRKLKYNLLDARKTGKQTLLTFGGAFSNHIYAVAAAGKEYGLHTIGIIRGEAHVPLNPTLSFATTAGMRLHYMDRETYRQKDKAQFLDELEKKFGDFYLIPEGGSNALAVKGCSEIMQHVEIPYDYVCCACGTGGTLAGLIAGSNPRKQIIGFSALKGGEFLYQDVQKLLEAYYVLTKGFIPEPFISHPWLINTDYHMGGYAKFTTQLLNFIRGFVQTHRVPLEQVYTGKMLFGIYDLIEKGYFTKGETIIAIHTGGLQGRTPLLDKSISI